LITKPYVSDSWCPAIYDGILCWPATAPNQTATLPCPGSSAEPSENFAISVNLLTNTQFKKLIFKILSSKHVATTENGLIRYQQDCPTTQMVTQITPCVAPLNMQLEIW